MTRLCDVVRPRDTAACSKTVFRTAVLAGLLSIAITTAQAAEPLQAESPIPEPATVTAAAETLDLRSFPVMKDAENAHQRQLGHLRYDVKADPGAALAFQQTKLEELGWRELPETQRLATHASAHFTKNDFVLGVTAIPNSGATGEAGTSVSLLNLGNIAAENLPKPSGVQPFHSATGRASYISEEQVSEIAEQCKQLLLADGWQPYGTASADPSSPMMYFKRHAIRVMLWVSSAPAQGGKTVINYSTELLSADLPLPADAPDARYNDEDRSLRFDWPSTDTSELISFYRDALQAQGWRPTTDKAVENDRKSFWIFRNEAKALLSLDLQKFNAITRVKLQHQTAAEFAEEERKFKEAQKKQQQAAASTKARPAQPKSLQGTKTSGAAAKSTKGDAKPTRPGAPGFPDGIEVELPDLPEDVLRTLKEQGITPKTKKRERTNAGNTK